MKLALQRGRLSGICERAALLEELERRNEGLTAGVQQVLARARGHAPGPFQAVLGLVADVIEVPMQWAPLFDAALGSVTQHIVLQDSRVIEQVEAGTLRPAGRVGFLSLSDVRPEEVVDTHVQDQVGVLGRLDTLIEASTELQPLLRQLLGRTWAVEMLTHARQLRAAGYDQLRFVTLRGEVVNPDGTVVAGPKDVAGLISRRTELRNLRQEENVLREQIREASAEIERVSENIGQQQLVVRELSDDQQQQSRQLAACQVKAEALRGELNSLREEIDSLESARQATQSELGDVAQRDV